MLACRRTACTAPTKVASSLLSAPRPNAPSPPSPPLGPRLVRRNHIGLRMRAHGDLHGAAWCGIDRFEDRVQDDHSPLAEVEPDPALEWLTVDRAPYGVTEVLAVADSPWRRLPRLCGVERHDDRAVAVTLVDLGGELLHVDATIASTPGDR